MKTAAVSAPLLPDSHETERARRKQAEVLKLIRKSGRDGRQSLGAIRDTELARDAFALGEAYRKAQTCS